MFINRPMQVRKERRRPAKAIFICRKKNKKRYPLGEQPNQPKGEIEFGISSSCKYSQLRAVAVQQQCSLPFIAKPVETRLQRKPQRSFTESDVLKEQQYLMKLFKNYQSAKQRIKTSHPLPQPEISQKYMPHSKSFGKVLKSKSAPKKIIPCHGCMVENDRGSLSALKNRMRELSLASCLGEQSPELRIL